MFRYIEPEAISTTFIVDTTFVVAAVFIMDMTVFVLDIIWWQMDKRT